MPKLISFASGSLRNVPVLERVLRQSLSEVNTKMLLGYADPLGLPELRKRVAELHEAGLTKENVMITSSAQQGLALVFEYLEGNGKASTFFQEPAYFGAIRILKKKPSNHLIASSEFKNLESLLVKETPAAIYLTSNFHNPTGISISDGEKIKIAEYAIKHGSVVIEDNPYDLLYYGPQRPSNILSSAPKNTIYVSGFSKVLAPGLRTGYIIADSKTIDEIKSLKITADIFTSTLTQKVCEEALKHPEYLEGLRCHFKQKRDLALATLENYFCEEKEFSYTRPEGGIFILGTFGGSISVEKLRDTALSRHGLILEKDEPSYFNGKSRNTTRINFVQNPDDMLTEGIGRLYNAFKEAGRK